jgi:hypothetical protein
MSKFSLATHRQEPMRIKLHWTDVKVSTDRPDITNN